MKQQTRQRKWQIEKQNQGLCIICAKPADSGSVCSEHRDQRRTHSREYYRKKHGIPLDAPLSTRGRKRLESVKPKKQGALAAAIQACVKFLKEYPTRKQAS